MKRFSLAVAAIFFLISCSQQHNNGVNAGDAHDDAAEESHGTTNSFTLYSDHYEIFTEYGQLEEGKDCDFLVHITSLVNGYSAYDAGKVTAMLILSGQDLKLQATLSAVPGIYTMNFIPDKPGDGILKFMINAENVTDTLSVRLHILSAGESVEDHAEAVTAGLVRYTKEQAWKSDFDIMEIKPGEFSQVVTASGEFMAMPGEKQNVIARSQGIVLFGSKTLVQGIWVNKGDILFTLSGEGLADNNINVRFNEARINFEKSRSELQRHKVLLREKIISDRQFIETESRYINDSILYYSLKETVGASGMKITAPMSGYLHELNVSEGQYVEPGNLMATVSTNRVILLRADVSQQYYKVLDRVVTTNFRPAYTEKVYTLEELSGKLMARGASVAENNHYLPVYFEVVNDGTLLEGAFAEFYLKTAPEPGHIVIPVTALIEEQGNYYVYVQANGEMYEKRAVRLKAADGLFVSISSGLSTGEHIVSEGAMLVKTATSAALPAHTHSH